MASESYTYILSQINQVAARTRQLFAQIDPIDNRVMCSTASDEDIRKHDALYDEVIRLDQLRERLKGSLPDRWCGTVGR